MSKRPNYVLEDILDKLPRRAYWFTREVAEAFGVTVRAIQKNCQKHDIGKKVRSGPKGTYVYEIDDIKVLVKCCKGIRGNPNWS